MTRQALTAEMIAQIAAGATPAASAATPAAPSVVAPAAAAAPAAPAAAAAPAAPAAAAAPAAPAAAAAPAAPAAAEAAAAPAAPKAAAAPAPAAAAPAAPAADVTAYLQAQIVTKDAALLANGVEIAGLKAKIADTDASLTGLKAIAAASISNMRVALGGAKTDLSALTATELLAQHAATKAEFETKFVAGGVAAVDAAQAPKPSAEQSLTAQRLDRISA